MKSINKSRAFWLVFFILLIPLTVWVASSVVDAFKYERAKMEIEKDEKITAELISNSGLSSAQWFENKKEKCFSSAMSWVEEHGARTNNLGIPYESEQETVSFLAEECTRSWNGNSFVPLSDAIPEYAKKYWWKIAVSIAAMIASVLVAAWLVVYGVPAAIGGFINWITKPESR